MIFLLEGLDKTGKTTLAQRLSKYHQARIVKFSAPGSDAYAEYTEFLDHADPAKNYVLDRFCQGELCYGPELRGKSQLSFEDLRYLELRLLSFNVVPIFCHTDVNHITQNMARCGEETTQARHVIGLTKRYLELVEVSSLLDWHLYDYRKPDTPRLDLKHRQLRLTRSQLENWLGPVTPVALFVLDQKNPNRQERHILDSSSGRFLLACLWKMLGKQLSRLAFTNQDRLDPKLLKRGSRTLAMGKKAQAKLISLECNLRAALAHPQYAKRFYGKRGQKRYEKELKDALLS